jgi:hypothetical protein
MTLNPLGGHFGDGEGGAGFLVGVAFFVVAGFLLGAAALVAVGLGELLTVGEGVGDSVTAKLCGGRREIRSVIAKTNRFIDRSI